MRWREVRFPFVLALMAVFILIVLFPSIALVLL